MPEPYLEPWLRGPTPGLDPVIAHLLQASEQIREDVAAALSTLTTAQVWATPDGMTSAGFHAKHLAGSTNRLCVYLEGHRLDAAQLASIATEATGSESADELTALVNTAFDRYNSAIRHLQPNRYADIREVGRKRLIVTAIGLAIHIVEHGQRHAGQLMNASKLVRAHGV